MRRYIYLCLLVTILGCASDSDVPPSKLEMPVIYTAYNIWLHDRTVFCINFKTGDRIIPAGTAVRDIEIKPINENNFKNIRFRIADTGEMVKVRFIGRWHPGETIESYHEKMFGPKDFTALTEGFSASEIEAIQQGVVVEGMSKAAVLVTYGYPPEHANTGFESNRWVYWKNKLNRKAICFNLQGRAVSCSGEKQLNAL